MALKDFDFVAAPPPRDDPTRPGPRHRIHAAVGCQVAIPAMTWMPDHPVTTYFRRDNGDSKWTPITQEEALHLISLA